jgi:hypothetical protein
MKKLAVITTLTAFAAAVAVPAARGSNFNVFIDYGGADQFVGHVEGKSSCLEDRKVTLYFVQQGRDKKIGAAKTFEGKGETTAWIVKTKNDNLSDGKYYAKVNDTGNCPGDKSKKFGYPPTLRSAG